MILSALALLLASCGKESILGRRNPQAIKLTVQGVMDTKASVITTSTLSSFYLSSYATRSWRKDSIGQSTPLHDPGLYVDPVGGSLKDIQVTKGSGWTITGNEDESSPAFSWLNDVAMNFFAYAPSADPTASDAAKGTLAITKADNSLDAYYPFTYAASVVTSTNTVSSGDCDDLLFAYASNKVIYESDNTSADFGNLMSGSETFNLTFYHALAQIRFCVSTDDGTFNPAISLKSVTLKGVSSAGLVANGNCTFNGSASTFGWTLGTTKANYTQTFGGTAGSVTFGTTAPTGWVKGSYTDSGSNTYNLYTCTDDVLFLIPQNPKDCVVDITLNVGGTDTTITGKLKAVDPSNSGKIWEAGKVYTYKIKAGKNGGLDLLPDGWANGGGGITIN